jgi:2-desacetyl-2-hydroxyethyl bacteriochlorophyllide A dehydrogenase
MNTSGKKIVLSQNGEISIQKFPIPTPGENQVLVKTICNLISAGTELGIRKLFQQNRTYGNHVIGVPKWLKNFSNIPEREIGYSNIGRIVEMGDALREDHSFPFTLEDTVLTLGSHSSHVLVSTEPENLISVPEDLSPEQAAFGVLGGVSIYGIETADIRLGDHVAIFGMGIVGQLALQMAKLCGCDTLTAIDIEPMRLAIARKSGATHTLNPEQCDIAEQMKSITKGRGVDVIIEASGYSSALVTAIEIARLGAKIVLLGSPWEGVLEIDFFLIHLKELRIIGCHQPLCPTTSTSFFPWTKEYNRNQVLKMIQEGKINVEQLITQRLTFDRAEEAYRKLYSERNKALGIVLIWENNKTA